MQQQQVESVAVDRNALSERRQCSYNNNENERCARFYVKFANATEESALNGQIDIGHVVYKLARIFQRATNEYGEERTNECVRSLMLDQTNVFVTRNLAALSVMSVEDMRTVLALSFKLRCTIQWTPGACSDTSGCRTLRCVCSIDDRAFLQRYGASAAAASSSNSQQPRKKKRKCDVEGDDNTTTMETAGDFPLPPRSDFTKDKPLHWTRQLDDDKGDNLRCILRSPDVDWHDDKLLVETNQLADIADIQSDSAVYDDITDSLTLVYGKFAYLEPLLCRGAAV